MSMNLINILKEITIKQPEKWMSNNPIIFYGWWAKHQQEADNMVPDKLEDLEEYGDTRDYWNKIWSAKQKFPQYFRSSENKAEEVDIAISAIYWNGMSYEDVYATELSRKEFNTLKRL